MTTSMLATRSASMLFACAILSFSSTLAAQNVDRLRDRGPGIPTSMFGTYIEKGDFLVYPFFEYYRDKDAEYSPDEFGFGLDQDFRGAYRANEWLLFFGYGISDRLVVEFEMATISAHQSRDPADPTAMPATFSESGLGDVEGQLRWRLNRESERKPEFFSYFETVFPLQKNKHLIGTQNWEFKFGTGLVRGFSWGTATVRAAVEYDAGEAVFGLGEIGLEYLRKLSSRVQILAALEGAEDEIEGITEVQLRLSSGITLKLNNAFGVTSKAADWAPEVGVIFRFR